MQEQGFTLQDLGNLMRRRWRLMGAVALFVLLAAIVVTWSLDNVYRSTSFFIIECPEVPDPLLPGSCGEGDQAQRIQRIYDTVMTRDNLAEIIDRHDLYRQERGSGSADSVVREMRPNILLELVYAADDPRNKNLGPVAGFELSFFHGDPAIAKAVASDLAALVTDADRQRRMTALTEAEAGLATEANRWRDALREAEAKLADFKERNPGAMPEDRNFNRQQVERKQSELEGINAQIRDLEANYALLQTQLSQTEPYVSAVGPTGEILPGSAERARALQAELIRLLAIYSPDHPDVQRVRRELESLSGTESGAGLRQVLEAELNAKRAQLDAARRQYGDAHPDVQRLERAVENLQIQIAQTPAASASTQPPNNPVYVQLEVRMRSVANELAALRAQRASVREQIADLEGRVRIAPEVERELLELTRDYDLARNRYQDARGRQEGATTSSNLIDIELTERYKLQRAASISYEPYFPNRVLFMIVGAFLAITFGAGAGIGAEAIDTRVRGTRDVNTLLDMPPIAAVPFIATAADRRRHTVRRFASVTAVVALVVLVGAYVHLQRTGVV